MKGKEPTMLELANKVVHSDAYKAKAIAYFVFRELIEDVHDRISDDEMAELNRRAVDRAYALVKSMKSKNLTTGILLNCAYGIREWDNPRDTEEYRAIIARANTIADGDIPSHLVSCLRSYVQRQLENDEALSSNQQEF